MYGSSFYLVNTGNRKSTGLRFMCVAQSAVEPYVPIVWPSELHYVNPASDSQGAWGWRKFDGKAIEFHGGIGVRDSSGSAEGKVVRAAAAGKVYAYETSSGYGQYIIIEHDIPGKGKYCSLYGHMIEGSMIANGTTVKAGDPIGKIGNTGNTTKTWDPDLQKYVGGYHLHFEFWRGGQSDGKSAWINTTNLYAHRDTRTTSTNPQPLFKKSGSIYAYNSNFDWSYSGNPLPDKYSHDETWQN